MTSAHLLRAFMGVGETISDSTGRLGGVQGRIYNCVHRASTLVNLRIEYLMEDNRVAFHRLR